jgi:transcriptional regulator with XRE-family HTH domain
MNNEQQTFGRISLRSEFQSLFWNVLLARKRQGKFTLKALADKLGINKSYVSRSFSSPPNWQIDKIYDMADALEVDLIVEARDRKNARVIYTASGIRDVVPAPATTSGKIDKTLQDDKTKAGPEKGNVYRLSRAA